MTGYVNYATVRPGDVYICVYANVSKLTVSPPSLSGNMP